MLITSVLLQGASSDHRPPSMRLMTLLLVVYVYDMDQDTFTQLPDMPESLPVQLWNAKKALQSIDQGALNACACLPHNLQLLLLAKAYPF